MTEANLSKNLVLALKKRMPGSVVFKHNDRITAGIPDISVTWRGRTVWIEVKAGRYPLSGIQNYVFQRMGQFTLVVRYRERRGGRETLLNDNLKLRFKNYEHSAVASHVANMIEEAFE